MSAPPFMKLYIADYLADTTDLDATGHGAYLLLLMAMWRAGGKLPRDEKKLAKLAQCSPEQWAEIAPDIMAYFKVTGGVIRHSRITKEIARYTATLTATSQAGKASASKRANKNKPQASTSVENSLNENPTNQNQNQIEEREGSEDKSSGLGPPLDLDREAWEKGVGLLVSSGANPKSARSMFGKLVKSAGGARALLPAIVQAQVNGTADPASYLARAASRLSGTDRKSPRSDSDEVARIMAEPIF